VAAESLSGTHRLTSHSSRPRFVTAKGGAPFASTTQVGLIPVLGLMEAKFRYARRYSGKHYDVSVWIAAESSGQISIQFVPEVELQPSQLRAIELGLLSAWETSPLSQPLSITVVDATDHSGVTGDMGYMICAEAAMHHLLGCPEKAPFPGHVADEA